MAKFGLTQGTFSINAHQQNKRGKKASGAKTGYPLNVWADAFLMDRRAQNLAKGSIRFYQEKLDLFLRFCREREVQDMVDITPDLLRRFLLELEENGHNPGGVHAAHRTLRSFLNWWEDEVEPEDWRNPIKRVKAPRVPEEPLEPVDLETVRSLIATCHEGTFTDARDKAILLFLLDTGVRISECLALDLEDINLATGETLIRQGKGRKPRLIFLQQKARRSLRTYLKHRTDDCEAVWVTDEGTRIGYDGVRGILTRRSAKAGIEDVPSPHDFRRAFAINMLRNGVDLITLSRLMGHASLTILKRYLKQVDVDLAEASRKGSPVDHARLG